MNQVENLTQHTENLAECLAFNEALGCYKVIAGSFTGEENTISTSADRAYSVYAADLDGDGDFDVLSASGGDDKIAWYENDGNGNFGSQQIISTSADLPSTSRI